jgi:hypothetical protein
MILHFLDEFVASIDLRFGVQTLADAEDSLDCGHGFRQCAISKRYSLAVTIVPTE